MSKRTNVNTTIADLLTKTYSENVYSDGSLFRIGELAEEFGLTLRALRFYEDRGLLAPRRAGVTRLYDMNDHTRLRLIQFGRRIGFTLGEMSQLIDFWKNGATDSGQLRAMREKFIRKLEELENKRTEIDRSIDELRAVLARLAARPV